jgi:hypothetical protein
MSDHQLIGSSTGWPRSPCSQVRHDRLEVEAALERITARILVPRNWNEDQGQLVDAATVN